MLAIRDRDLMKRKAEEDAMLNIWNLINVEGTAKIPIRAIESGAQHNPKLKKGSKWLRHQPANVMPALHALCANPNLPGSITFVDFAEMMFSQTVGAAGEDGDGGDGLQVVGGKKKKKKKRQSRTKSLVPAAAAKEEEGDREKGSPNKQGGASGEESKK